MRDVLTSPNIDCMSMDEDVEMMDEEEVVAKPTKILV